VRQIRQGKPLHDEEEISPHRGTTVLPFWSVLFTCTSIQQTTHNYCPLLHCLRVSDLCHSDDENSPSPDNKVVAWP